jgi:hypothetical protein
VTGIELRVSSGLTQSIALPGFIIYGSQKGTLFFVKYVSIFSTNI